MLDTIRNRLILIGLLVALSVGMLFVRYRENAGADIQSPVKLGLDLQGGMHLELELDQSQRVSADPARDIELALTVLRKRIDEFGVTEPLIQKQGDDRIVVELAGVTDPERARQIIQRSAFLEFRITDETGALEKAVPAMDRELRALGIRPEGGAGAGAGQPSAVQELLGGSDTARAGADSAGRDSARRDSAGRDSAAGDTSPITGGVLAGLIQQGNVGTPGAYAVPETAWQRVDSLLRIPQVRRLLPRGKDFFWAADQTSVGVQSYRFLYVVDDRPMITGANLIDAVARLDPLTNAPEVGFTLDRRGGREFNRGTSQHVGDYMAIILDNKVQGPPPVIQSAIGREGRITLGGKTIEEARDLALTLKAGALPTPLKIIDRREVGASLGKDAIKSSILAGVIGTIFVVVVMVAYYRMAGVLAIAALLLYVLFSLGGLSLFDATLTLPGLAGLVLSIGIAVDANVLIFERIREELDAGKTVSLAVNEGFTNAMSAIIDSNVTTILTALFLFQFGTGPVKGFAVTLVIGILASMVTAIFVTRTFFMIWLRRKPAMQTLSI